jgi:hypothetical protein
VVFYIPILGFEVSTRDSLTSDLMVVWHRYFPGEELTILGEHIPLATLLHLPISSVPLGRVLIHDGMMLGFIPWVLRANSPIHAC